MYQDFYYYSRVFWILTIVFRGISTWVKNVYSDSSSLESVGQFFGVQYVG
jgi:hypothetical protein